LPRFRKISARGSLSHWAAPGRRRRLLRLAPVRLSAPRSLKTSVHSLINRERRRSTPTGLIDLKMKMEEQAADEASHPEVMSRLLG